MQCVWCLRESKCPTFYCDKHQNDYMDIDVPQNIYHANRYIHGLFWPDIGHQVIGVKLDQGMQIVGFNTSSHKFKAQYSTGIMYPKWLTIDEVYDMCVLCDRRKIDEYKRQFT